MKPSWEDIESEPLSDAQASQLEKLLVHNEQADGIVPRLRLISYYFQKGTPHAETKRSQHILWLIAHHPECCLYPPCRLRKQDNPIAFNDAEERWLSAISHRPNDTQLLWAASNFLRKDSPVIADGLARRGQALEPGPAWHELLAKILNSTAAIANPDQRPMLFAQAVHEAEQALALHAPRKRYKLLIIIADAALGAGNLEKAELAANALLAEGEQRNAGQNYTLGIHRAHIVLGRIAIAHGDVPIACSHLVAAAQLALSTGMITFSPDLQLASEIWSYGEHECVLSYVDLCIERWPVVASELQEWKRRVTAGGLPGAAGQDVD